MASFAPVAQHHLFRKENISLDPTMESDFPRQDRWILSRGEDFNMSFAISNICVEFMSTFKNRYYIPKPGESKSHCLVTNKLRKEDGHKNRFPPISERTNSFVEI